MTATTPPPIVVVARPGLPLSVAEVCSRGERCGRPATRRWTKLTNTRTAGSAAVWHWNVHPSPDDPYRRLKPAGKSPTDFVPGDLDDRTRGPEVPKLIEPVRRSRLQHRARQSVQGAKEHR